MIYALEQCGLLLRDATVLCGSGSHAVAAALAAFARAELTWSRRLRELRRQVLVGMPLTVEQFRREWSSHQERRAPATGSKVDRELVAMTGGAPRRQTASFCVGLDEAGTGWIRPSDYDWDSARRVIEDVVDAYRRAYDRMEGDNPKSSAQELLAALETWTDRPKLPKPAAWSTN